jgi:hypothetical protein
MSKLYSKLELVKIVDDVFKGSVNLVLGKDSETIKNQYLLSYQTKNLNNQILLIVDNNIKPTVLKHLNKLIIGFNKQIDVLTLEDCSQIKSIKLESLFTEFIELKNENLLIVFETGLICLNQDFETVWTYSKDVLQDYHFDFKKSLAMLEFMDEGKFIIDLNSGKEIK